MNFILTGILLGSIVTSGHDTRELCEGRKVMLAEKGVHSLKCTDHNTLTGFSSGSNCITINGQSCAR